jgi:DNA repair photolyase
MALTGRTVPEHEREYPPIKASGKDFLAKELDVLFPQTKFGCMGVRHVVHFEPTPYCEHKCGFCYAKSYMGLRDKSEPALRMRSEDLVAAVAKEYRRIAARSEMTPEMHMSISTDSLQPRSEVQEVCYLVQQAWLKCGGLVSVVSKGIPHSSEFRRKLLSLWAAYPTHVSFQGTIASMDAEKQHEIEPGAPAPMVRLEFLRDAVASGLVNCSLRINPIIPDFNDSPQSIANTIEAGRLVGVKWAAISYIYGSKPIFGNLKRVKFPIRTDLFESKMTCLKGGAGKLHVIEDIRRRTTEMAKARGREVGIAVSSCGCDNSDIYPEDKCRICFNSRKPGDIEDL